jgi:hypothetical protein
MTLYHLVNRGPSPLTFLAIPMLGDKHAKEYPRFRDVFAGDDAHPEFNQGRGDQFYIHLYTRVGGNNRNCGYGEEELYKHPHYVATFDDGFDSTYATYIFTVPQQWVHDWKCALEGRWLDFTPEYREQCEKVFPLITEPKAWPWDEPDYWTHLFNERAAT